MDPAASTHGSIDGYASALLSVARAEGDPDGIADQIFRIARAFDSSEPLRKALTDPRIPADRKQGIVDELLGSRTPRAVLASVNLVIGAGRASDFGAIATRMAQLAASEGEQELAEVRSAIELDEATIGRLEERLSAATGKRIKAKVVVDPKVLGGLVAKVGDTVFDGSVRSRLDGLREAWG